MSINLEKLNELWGQATYEECPDFSTPLGPVCIDTRSLIEGSFFVPLIGERFDGHEFLPEAFSKGAQAAVVSKKSKLKIPSKFLHWVVEDTLDAYQQLALLHRRNLRVPVIAITGSVGKTTTREMIKEILKPLGLITSTQNNNNNDIGVPLTLFQADLDNAAVVVEMAMRGFGEIERLSRCTEPDIAVITNIGNAHIGRLGSRRNIAIAKCEITTNLKSTGVVIIPAYDQLLEEVLNDCWNGRILKIGIKNYFPEHIENCLDHLPLKDQDVDFQGDFSVIDSLLKVEDTIFKVPFGGMHNAMNFMLALGVAKELGMNLSQIPKLNIQTPSGRNCSLNIGGITVLDETYNSSPESVIASMKLLVARPGRHFAVLGAMRELGEHSFSFHCQIAELAIDLSLDGLIFIGDGVESEAMSIAAKSLQTFKVVSSIEESFKYLISWLIPGDTVLLKASRSVELEGLIPLLKNFL
ncbi:UDP-N-acetylmuramoyl-tripeptide--D-alanyl-D-alanine ligase [Prochlorococcus sp. MIT 1223]|uniref:UDP-N-acetylmuramoyl-tripeptide--D-alanyl-D- alanine ligase n=1 Tax=Prochlorococcus sp. MIT 1223 TaxID=3096217 RepID=UPI002A765717|nr:UDP-N-acetylmuramoyl-tripeptide--D-alanyl-D-alanine ligase [Prochlorococcus sp. MIT 1223]